MCSPTDNAMMPKPSQLINGLNVMTLLASTVERTDGPQQKPTKSQVVTSGIFIDCNSHPAQINIR